ncbi:hypothetical protein CRUP_024237 [Coryphaenoides rupestris]|nr:hypothetical protein CRUP_024237 [Coryphaenoides rupestris]
MREEASDILYNSKERRSNSINRNFVGDYLGLEHKPELRQFLAKRERVDFADSVNKFDRRFKVKKGPEKGQIKEVLKRKLEFGSITGVSMSSRQDDFFVLHESQYDSLLESSFKTEFLSLLCKRYEENIKRKLTLYFNDRVLLFQRGQGDLAQVKPGGKALTISVGDGLPKTSRHANGAAQFSRGHAPQGQTDVAHSAPQRQSRPPHGALPKLGSHKTQRSQASQRKQGNQDFLNVPDQGMSGAQRKKSIGQRPPPAPKPRPQPQRPQCRALYQYVGQDADEISFNVSDIFELVKEDPSGWWTGKIRGHEGLFPGNYVEKI